MNLVVGSENVKASPVGRKWRTAALLLKGARTSMEIIDLIGTTTPTKCISEVRSLVSIVVLRRLRAAGDLFEYRAFPRPDAVVDDVVLGPLIRESLYSQGWRF